MDDETREEQEQAADVGIDGEEEHRYAEFEDLRDRIERLTDLVTKVLDWTAGADAAMVQNGETVIDDDVTVTDVDGDGDLDIVEETPDIDPADLEL